jgi:hypothetical protein
MKFLRRQLLLWTCVLLSTALSFGQNSKIAPDLLKQLGNAGSVNVVVQYTPSASSGGGLLGGLLGLVDDILGGLLNLISDLGGVVTQQYSSVPGLAATMPASQVSTLANNSSVTYVSLDRPVAGTLDLTAAATGADLAYQAGHTGAGVGVAIVDSGIYHHPDVASSTARASSRRQTWTITATARMSPASSRAAARLPPGRNSRGPSAASRPARI